MILNHFLEPAIRHTFRNNLMSRFREKLKNVDFGPKNGPFMTFCAKKFSYESPQSRFIIC